MKTKSSRDGLGVRMFRYENLAVFSEDRSKAGDVIAFCSGRISGEQNIIMKAHYGDWGLRFSQVSQLSDKASDLTCMNLNNDPQNYKLKCVNLIKRSFFSFPQTRVTIKHFATSAV